MTKPDVQTLIAAADLILEQPAARPVEGSPIGNGRMGTMVWTTPGTVEFQVNRVDVFAVNRNASGRRFCPADQTVDYGGACGRITLGVGGAPFGAGPAFRQHLSLNDARCTVAGDGVTAACWISAVTDVLVITLADTRAQPQPVEVRLAMCRAPEARHGSHVASYAFRETAGGMAVVQTFREADHYCSSAVAVQAPGNAAQPTAVGERARILRLPAARGVRTVLVASAAAWDERSDAGPAAEQVLEASSAPNALQAMAEQHAQWWRAFWQRTHVDIKSPDGRGERAARDRVLFLYYMAATSRGAYPPKWNGSIFLTDGDARDWGSQFWLWTTEMLYWPLLAADASDLSASFFDMYRWQLPALEIAARQRWNAAGIFLPEVVPFDGPGELPEDLVGEFRDIFLYGIKPNTAISPRLAARCQFEHHLSWLLFTRVDTGCDTGHSWCSHMASSGAELAVHAWWRYRYTGDDAWLRSHAYPLLRGVAEFYRSYVREDWDSGSYYHVENTNVHEDYWGVTDSIMDLAAIRGIVPLAIRAAEILGVDDDLRQPWRTLLDRLAPYPMGGPDRRARRLGVLGRLADDAWAAGFKGKVDGSHNPADFQLAPIFPFEDWTLETRGAAMDAVARRTLELAPCHRRVLAGEPLSTAIRSPIAIVRAGKGEELPAILDRYRDCFKPLANGFSLFEQAYVPGFQAHSIEHLGLLTMTLQEALLQSVSPRPGEPEIISVFPAWPRGWDASFRLLARGGFLVSASRVAGTVQAVEIHSRRGETCRFRNCLAGRCTVSEEAGPQQQLDGDILTFSTKPGRTYRIEVCR